MHTPIATLPPFSCVLTLLEPYAHVSVAIRDVTSLFTAEFDTANHSQHHCIPPLHILFSTRAALAGRLVYGQPWDLPTLIHSTPFLHMTDLKAWSVLSPDLIHQHVGGFQNLFPLLNRASALSYRNYPSIFSLISAVLVLVDAGCGLEARYTAGCCHCGFFTPHYRSQQRPTAEITKSAAALRVRNNPPTDWKCIRTKEQI